MKNRVSDFLKAVKPYLEASFNAKAAEYGTDAIQTWQIGWPGTMDSASAYPCCLLIVPDRSVSIYSTTFTLYIGIGIKTLDPKKLVMTGQLWEDIFEDVIRSDRTFGGAALTIVDDVQISTAVTSDTYMIHGWVNLEVDTGGFVYG